MHSTMAPTCLIPYVLSEQQEETDSQQYHLPNALCIPDTSQTLFPLVLW